MRRRRLLASTGAVLAAGLAGCSGGGGDEETVTETATPTPTRTATPTETPTATPTPTPTPTAPTHDLNESFVVGEGDDRLRYTFERFLRAEELGPTGTEQADGVYLLVVLRVENPQSETVSIPSLQAESEGVIRNVDSNASQAAGSDDRLDVDSIASATVAPDSSVRGVVAFDVPTGNEYRIRVPPTGSGTSHVVPVGDVGGVERLGSGY